MKSSVILPAVVFGAFAIFTTAVAIFQLIDAEIPSAVVALGGTAFCLGFVIPAFTIGPGRVAPRIESAVEGTTFRPDRGVEIPMQAAMAGALVSSTLILILLPAGRLAIPVPPNMRYALPFAAAIAVVCIAPMLWRNIKRGSASYLRLTERGFEFVQGWHPRGAEWASVQDVAADAPNQKAATPGAIVFILGDGTALSFTATAYTPGGDALRELVRYYWSHPESRDELSDDRSRTRLMATLR